MRTNTGVMLGASVAFGALAVLLARGWIQSAVQSEFIVSAPSVQQVLAPMTPEVVTTPVVVASRAIRFGEPLTYESFEIVEYPEDSVPMDTFSDIDTLFGLEPQLDASGEMITPVALTDIRAMEPIFADRISGPGAKGSLSARIRPGYVASAVPVDPVRGVGGFVVPGDLVDVMHLTQPELDDNPELFQSHILLQAVRVLGIDQNAVQSTSEPATARTVTLEVDRRDLQIIALATETGILSLALRGAGETDFITAPSLRSDNLPRAQVTSVPKAKPRRAARLASARPAAPAKPSDRTNIKVVRGDEVTRVVVRRTLETTQSAALTTDDAPQAGWPQTPPAGALAGGQTP